MYDAARACLLLDLRRFLQIAYCGKKDKTGEACHSVGNYP